MSIVGIDLGTTNSLVAYWDGEKPQLIPNAIGELITPSVISFDKDGQVLIGESAKQRMISHPELSVAEFKRKMGTSAQYKLAGKKFTPEDFSDSQRKATKVAGELAGLKVERLINEPTAAAVAYGVHDREEESQFLVVDLGGGTFDVSVLELFDGVMEVHASAGDNYLGGEDFTQKITEWFLEKNQLNLKSLTPEALNLLSKRCQVAKHELSTNEQTVIKFHSGKSTFEQLITRSDLDHILKDTLERLKSPIERAIRDSKVKLSELDDVLLVGGATRMPIVRNLIGRLFRRLPACTIDPDHVVALGTAIQAALKSRDQALKDIVLTDICPYTLGVDVVQELKNNQYQAGYFLPIIERNSMIPVSRVQTLNTVADNQKKINCSIYQGESRLVKNNIKLGEVEINVPKGKAGDESVDVRFTYDINGILEVSIKVNSTEEVRTSIIKSEDCQLTDEQIAASMKKLEQIKIHPREQAENRLRLAKAERLYEESLGDKRDFIASIVAQYESILETQDLKSIEKYSKEFDETLQSLEEDVF